MGRRTVMLLCMRTTIDLPDPLLKRVRKVLAARNMTLRSLVISALERELCPKPRKFKLREASAGYDPKGRRGVTAEQINRAIDDQRASTWRA